MTFVASLLLFNSCEKKSEGLTRITYYAVIELEGESSVVVDKGSAFVDPGFTATMNGEDVSDEVVVSGDVDASTSGVYTITYSIVNEDGFSSSVTRTVIVLDTKDPIEGFWATDPTSFRIYNGGAPVLYGASFEILIIGQGGGKYLVDDLMAGWYAQRAGYGSNYAMQALITVADDGGIALNASYVPGWGDSADDCTDGIFDAATQTISYKLFYAGVIEFDVTLNKIAL